MDDFRLGLLIRALRIRLGVTQADLAIAATTSPAMISRFERGRIDATSVRTLRRVFASLDARLDLVPRWQGADLDCLLDARHAGMTETLVRACRACPTGSSNPR